jgi:hypothetical protein
VNDTTQWQEGLENYTTVVSMHIQISLEAQRKFLFVEFVILTAATIKNYIFWDVTPLQFRISQPTYRRNFASIFRIELSSKQEAGCDMLDAASYSFLGLQS